MSIRCPRNSSKDEVARVETHVGCSSSCVYCTEANTPVRFNKTEQVINEIRFIAEKGFDRFDLCDPEFNEDLDLSVEFCAELKQSGMKLKWAPYMKPANYNRTLFQLMKATGVHLIYLTVDSYKKCQLYWSDIEKIVFSAQSNGIEIVINFTTGFPYEDEDILIWSLDFFRRLQPDRVNVNTSIRLHKSVQLLEIIMRDHNLRDDLVGKIENLNSFSTILYKRIDQKKLGKLIAGERIFRIEEV